MFMRFLLALILAALLAVPAGAEQEIPNDGGAKIKGEAGGGAGEAGVDNSSADVEVKAVLSDLEIVGQATTSIRFTVTNVAGGTAKGVVIKIGFNRLSGEKSPRELGDVVALTAVKLDGQPCTVDAYLLTAECPAIDISGNSAQTASVEVEVKPKSFGGREEFSVDVEVKSPDGGRPDWAFSRVKASGSAQAGEGGRVQIELDRKPLQPRRDVVATLPGLDNPRIYVFKVKNWTKDTSATDVKLSIRLQYDELPAGAGAGPARIDASQTGDAEGITCTAAAGGIDCLLGDLTGDQTKKVRIKVASSAPGAVVADASVSIRETLHPDSIVRDDFGFEIASPQPELEITSSGAACGGQVKPGCRIVLVARFHKAAAALLGPELQLRLRVRDGKGKASVTLQRQGRIASTDSGGKITYSSKGNPIPVEAIAEGKGRIAAGPLVRVRNGHVIEAAYRPGKTDEVLAIATVGDFAKLNLVSEVITERVKSGETARIRYTIENKGSIPTSGGVSLLVKAAPTRIADLSQAVITGCVEPHTLGDEPNTRVCKIRDIDEGETISVMLSVKVLQVEDGNTLYWQLYVAGKLSTSTGKSRAVRGRVDVLGPNEVDIKIVAAKRERSGDGKKVRYDFTIGNSGTHVAKRVRLRVPIPSAAPMMKPAKNVKPRPFICRDTHPYDAPSYVTCYWLTDFPQFSLNNPIYFHLEGRAGIDRAIEARIRTSSYDTDPNNNRIGLRALP